MELRRDFRIECGHRKWRSGAEWCPDYGEKLAGEIRARLLENHRYPGKAAFQEYNNHAKMNSNDKSYRSANIFAQ